MGRSTHPRHARERGKPRNAMAGKQLDAQTRGLERRLALEWAYRHGMPIPTEESSPSSVETDDRSR